MTPSTMEKITNVGQLFRFATPLLIMIIGYLLNMGIVNIQLSIKNLDTHFNNHLMHHQDLEVGYERRLSRLEIESQNLKEKAQKIDSLEKKIYK